MKLLTTLAALLVAGSVAAQDVKQPAAPPVSEATAAQPSSVFYEGNRFGLQIDAGVPAGATAALVYRPWQFLRVNAGVGYDVVAFGVKGGVTLIPFHWGVVPTLSLEAGHFFEGDATKIASVNEPALKSMLSKVGYDYVLADLGIEFGAQNRFVFYVRAGLAKLFPSSGTTLNEALQQASLPSNVSVRANSDANYSAATPTARLGFILYLF